MFVIFAPNVHIGGGRVLLESLLAALPSDLCCLAILDRRVEGRIDTPAHIEVVWCDRSLLGRLRAEYALFRSTRRGDLIFCFHNLPPIFRSKGTVYCYVHNRYVIGAVSMDGAEVWVRLRVAVERLIARWFQRNVSIYIVQTPTMKRELYDWLQSSKDVCDTPIEIMPFVELPDRKCLRSVSSRSWDFIYIADGSAHKNHIRLFRALKLLADEGVKPSLAITVAKSDTRVLTELSRIQQVADVRIFNLGQISHDEVLEKYQSARAVIFASYAESFGIPLLEARWAGMPIIASERDFVRDVCVPVETFDPFSEVSMARAIKRFLVGCSEPLTVPSAREFISALLDSGLGKTQM